MEITQYNSNKYLQNASADPLASIFRQLRDLGSEQGDYIRIIQKETFFQPIYKISYLQQPKLKRQESSSLRKSFFRDSSNDNNLADQKLTNENQEKFRLSFGSQIYLKYNNLLNAKIALLKPKFSNLFVQLKIRGKGFIHCIEGKIIINNYEKTESIWMCICEQLKQSEQFSTKNEVYFCNFVENQYLYIDNNGIMTVCGEDRATRFTLTKIGNTNSYVLLGRNVLSQLVRNKSKEEIKKIIDRNIDRTEGSKQLIEVELEIAPVQDTMITIHLELNYSKKALEREPSLKLIKLILNELVYYDILDFLRDQSILSEHIQELLLEYQILTLISNNLQRYFQIDKIDQQAPILILPKRVSKDPIQSKFSKKNSKNQYDELLIQEILKTIGLLCKQNLQISKIFLQLLDQLIISELYQFAGLLLQRNQFFLSQFHKANWYTRLYRIMSRSNKHQTCKIINFLCYFCENQKQLTLIDSPLQYRHRPSTNNQFLLQHSIKAGDFFTRLFQYELYIEGNYVFVHDTKSVKDVQFHTFVSGSPSQNSQSIAEHSKMKMQNEDISQKQQSIQLVLAQLKLIKSLCYNYNPNVILNNWTIVYGLAPYCYKDNFPQLTHKELKGIILKMLIELQPYYKQAKLLSTFLVSCSLVQNDSNGRNSMNQSEPKVGLSNFVKNNKKRVQMSRKILKQMGNHFLKKAKEWYQSIKKKTLQIAQLCNNIKEQYYLAEWLQIMIQGLSMRLFKVKEKKEGQLLGYIKKLFESIEEKKGVVENEGNVMNEFMELLLEIAKKDTKYDKYLQQIKAKRVYDGKTNQINKVISNFQGKKQVNFTRTQKGLTKIELIDLVHKGLSNQQVNLRQSTRKQVQITNEQSFKQIKLITLRLIQLMILNVNEEMIDEAVDTLTYLMKNPRTISNLSAFNLLDMIPKYPNENLIKRIAIQQWYLTSNCHLLNEFTQILRLIYTKKMLYRRNINNVLLIDSQSVFKTYHHIVYPVKFLKKIVTHCETWLRPNLQQKYPDIYVGVDRNMQVIIDCLQKLSENGEYLQIGKIIQNVDLIAILSQLVEYMSSYYLQKIQTQLQKSLVFHSKNEGLFIETKLNPLSQKVMMLLSLYIKDKKGCDLFRSKMVIYTFGEIFSVIEEFSYLLVHIFKKNLESNERNLLDLLRAASPIMICNLAKNYSKTWRFFENYLYLQGEDLLREMNKLYQAGFNKFTEKEQEKFLKDLLNSSSIQSFNNIPQDAFEFSHQTIFMKILLKLIYNHYNIDIIFWFKEKVFWHLLESISKSNTQKYYKLELSNDQIKRRQLVAQLVYYYKEVVAFPHTISVISQREENQIGELGHLIIDFIVEEHQLSRLYIEDSSNQNQIRKITDSAYIQYLQYLVCDITVLAYYMDFLSVGQIYDDLHYYYTKLKNIYKSRVTYKSNEETCTAFSNIQKIFLKQPNLKGQYKLRTMRFQRLKTSSNENTSTLPETQSKPIRKWLKAVGELNKQKFLNKNSQFIEDILTFEDIYQLKNESEEINLVINHNDIFLKLFEVSLNMKRLKLNPQNQIFILENLLLLAKSKSKGKKELDQGLVEYGLRLLELLLEEQVITTNIDKESNFESVERWKINTYCLSLMLRIIEYSKCLSLYKIWFPYVQSITLLFALTLSNYQSDCSFLQLYFSTLHSKQEIQMFELIIPFETMLSILTNQIQFGNLEGDSFNFFATVVMKAYLTLNLSQDCIFRRYNNSQLLQIVESIEKQLAINIYNELDSSLYYKALLAIKK